MGFLGEKWMIFLRFNVIVFATILLLTGGEYAVAEERKEPVGIGIDASLWYTPSIVTDGVGYNVGISKTFFNISEKFQGRIDYSSTFVTNRSDIAYHRNPVSLTGLYFFNDAKLYVQGGLEYSMDKIDIAGPSGTRISLPSENNLGLVWGFGFNESSRIQRLGWFTGFTFHQVKRPYSAFHIGLASTF